MISEWNGTISRIQAIRLLDNATDRDDPFWEGIAQDFYDEETDTMPSIFHVFASLGITESEYKEATGADNVNWPKTDQVTSEGVCRWEPEYDTSNWCVAQCRYIGPRNSDMDYCPGCGHRIEEADHDPA